MNNTTLLDLVNNISDNPKKFYKKPEKVAGLMAAIQLSDNQEQIDILNKLLSSYSLIGTALVCKQFDLAKSLVKSGIRCNNNDAYVVEISYLKGLLDLVVDSEPDVEEDVEIVRHDKDETKETPDAEADVVSEDKAKETSEFDSESVTTNAATQAFLAQLHGMFGDSTTPTVNKNGDDKIVAKYNKKLNTLAIALGAGWDFNRKIKEGDVNGKFAAISQFMPPEEILEDSSDDEEVFTGEYAYKNNESPVAFLFSLIKNGKIDKTDAAMKVAQFFLCEAIIRCDAETYAKRKLIDVELTPEIITEFADKSPHLISDESIAKIQHFITTLNTDGELDDATAVVFSSVVKHHPNLHVEVNAADYPHALKEYQENVHGTQDISQLDSVYKNVVGDTPVQDYVKPHNRALALLHMALYPEIKALICDNALNERNMPGFRNNCINVINAHESMSQTERFLAASVAELHKQNTSLKQDSASLTTQMNQMQLGMNALQDKLAQLTVLIKGLKLDDNQAKNTPGMFRYTS